MNLHSVWLNVLIMLRRGGSGSGWRGCLRAALLRPMQLPMRLLPILLSILLMAGAAQATTFNFNGGNVVPICPLSGNTYNCASLPNSADTDVVIIASGYTVVVNSSVSFSYNQSLQMSGTATLQSKSDLTVADVNPANLKVTGGVLKASGTFSAGNQAQTIVADISAATINIGTGSTTKVTGTLTATSQITLASNVSIIGNVTAPTVLMKASSTSVKGDISAATALTIESNNTVNGNITGGALTMNDGGVVINGNATMTGDVSIGSSDTINGNLVARNVTTKASGDYISGNAAVNSIYLDYGATVGKVITCTGAGASGCSCVTRADSNYHPTCGAPSANGPDHIQISHSGLGLTCQPQNVTLKACADSNCSTTYTGTTTVALLPGGGNVTFSGTTTAAVRQSTATDTTGVTLSATNAGITNPNVCPNANTGTNNCHMVFSDSGLVLTATDHVSMTPGVSLSVQAKKTSTQGSCVPLVQNATVPVKFACAYVNPVPASANNVGVTLGGTNVSCGGGTTDVSLTFDNNGLATPSLQYSEVGQTNLTASYTSTGLGASGAASFTTAPAKIKIEPIRVASTSNFSTSAFAKASEPFTIKLTALNYNDVATKNFGRESPSPTSQNFLIPTPVLINPNGGHLALTVGGYQPIVDGVANALSGTPGQWKFDETGTLRFTVKLASSSTYYLDNTTAGFNPQATVDLVFVPDHFDVALAGTSPMNCAMLGGVNNPCINNANGKFIYSKQTFPLLINAYIGAKDSSNSYYLSPQNYAGAAARAITLSAWTAADATVAVPGGSASNSVGDFHWSGEPAATTRFTFSYDAKTQKTVGTLDASSSGNLPSFDFTTAPTAPTTIYVRATDADQASSRGAVEPLLTVVSGHLGIANVNGALNSPAPVTTMAQYYTGSAYVFNSQYQLASPGLPMYTTNGGVKTYFIQYSHCQNGLDTSSNKSYTCPGGSVLTLASPETITFVNGKGSFRLAAPSPALSRNGSVNVTLKNASNVDLIPYLPSDTGQVTFGIYRSGPVIYTREVYN